MKAYPVEFRHRVVELHARGWTTRQIQQALGVSRAWVDSIKRLHAAGQPLAVKSSANHRTSLADVLFINAAEHFEKGKRQNIASVRRRGHALSSRCQAFSCSSKIAA